MFDYKSLSHYKFASVPIKIEANIPYIRNANPSFIEKKLLWNATPYMCGPMANKLYNKYPGSIIINCGYKVHYKNGEIDDHQVDGNDKYHFFILTKDDEIIDPMIFLNIVEDSRAEDFGAPTKIEYFIQSSSEKVPEPDNSLQTYLKKVFSQTQNNRKAIISQWNWK